MTYLKDILKDPTEVRNDKVIVYPFQQIVKVFSETKSILSANNMYYEKCLDDEFKDRPALLAQVLKNQKSYYEESQNSLHTILTIHWQKMEKAQKFYWKKAQKSTKIHATMRDEQVEDLFGDMGDYSMIVWKDVHADYRQVLKNLEERADVQATVVLMHGSIQGNIVPSGFIPIVYPFVVTDIKYMIQHFGERQTAAEGKTVEEEIKSYMVNLEVELVEGARSQMLQNEHTAIMLLKFFDEKRPAAEQKQLEAKVKRSHASSRDKLGTNISSQILKVGDVKTISQDTSRHSSSRRAKHERERNGPEQPADSPKQLEDSLKKSRRISVDRAALKVRFADDILAHMGVDRSPDQLPLPESPEDLHHKARLLGSSRPSSPRSKTPQTPQTSQTLNASQDPTSRRAGSPRSSSSKSSHGTQTQENALPVSGSSRSSGSSTPEPQTPQSKSSDSRSGIPEPKEKKVSWCLDTADLSPKPTSLPSPSSSLKSKATDIEKLSVGVTLDYNYASAYIEIKKKRAELIKDLFNNLKKDEKNILIFQSTFEEYIEFVNEVGIKHAESMFNFDQLLPKT